MADNTILNPGASGDTVRSLARSAGSIKTQVVQLDLGGVSANSEVLITAGQQTMAASVPVAIASNQSAVPVSGTFWQTTQPVSQSGTWTVAQGTAAAASGAWTAKLTDGTNTAAVKAASTAAAATDPALVVAVSPNNTVGVTGTFWQATQPVSIASMPSTPVTGTFWQATQPVSLATLPALTAGSAIVGKVGIDQTTPGTTNLVSAAQNGTWTATVTQATAANLNATVTPIAITKGTQAATGFTVQPLRDAGRNVSNLFMVTPIVTTATDALQSLTGYKSGAAVVATTTPAVVTTGKTYRITRIVLSYTAVATAGLAKFTLRANTAGVVAIGSPAVDTFFCGVAGATAGFAQAYTIDYPDGLEFAAGTGIGVSVVGLNATMTAAAVGYASVSIYGFEY